MLQSAIRKLKTGYVGFGSVFAEGAQQAAEQEVRNRVEVAASNLAARVDKEISSLPFPTCAQPWESFTNPTNTTP